MLDKVRKTISDNNMLSAEDKVLVALSGGCDSVCLCLILKKLGVDFDTAHVNHMIRSEADDDSRFCEEFSQKLGVNFHLKIANIPHLAKKQCVSEEVAGRNVRYEFFQQLCQEHGFTKIAVAHNLNDNAETVLMNLLRGSGLKGLTGIPKVRNNIIRPLIDVTRQEIEEFVEAAKEQYVTDKTNFSEDYTRNKIRNAILPKLLEINPSALSNISKTSDILTHDDFHFDKEAEKYVSFQDGNSYIGVKDFEKLDYSLKARLLLLAYSHAAGTSKDFEKKHIDYIIENATKKSAGTIIELCFDVVCKAEYGNIVFEKKTGKNDYRYTLPINGEVYVKEAGVKFTAEIVTNANTAEKSKNVEFFDLEGIGEIVIRSRKNGDKFVPFGKNNEVKVKDILIKHKIPQKVRNNLPIIESKEILWIYGVRRSESNKICDKTQKILMIKGEKTNG